MIILQLWNSTCCFFSFFLNIRTIYQNLFFIQNLFPFFMQSHVFSCLYTIQVCEIYASLSSFFLFLHFVQISNMDDNTNYQEDYEKIYFLTYSHSKNKRSVKKISRLGSI